MRDIIIFLIIYRENELLKHQLKKYVGAVQALRSNMQSRSPETTEGKKALFNDKTELLTMSSGNMSSPASSTLTIIKKDTVVLPSLRSRLEVYSTLLEGCPIQ